MKMDISKRTTCGVREDGTIEGRPGSVTVEGGIRMAYREGGCGLIGCNCSPGFWISRSTPRNEKGEIETTIRRFNSKNDFEDAKKLLEAVGIKEE